MSGVRVAGSIAAILALGLLAAPAAAQQQETLLSRGFESGGFGGPMVQAMPVGDDLAVFVGGRGGWIINHAFSIGGGGWGLVTDVSTPVTDTTDTRLNIGYGGVILEYTLRPFELVHYSVSLLSGWGSAGYGDPGDVPADEFFVFEPAAHIEINVTEFFHVAAGASWRFADGIELDGFADEDLQEVAGILTFKFGSF
jgi:hypothetical protein